MTAGTVSTAYEIVSNLEQQWDACKNALERTRGMDGSETLHVRCEALVDLFKGQLQDIKRTAPAVEQLKGCARGLELADPVIRQHNDLWRNALPNPEDSERLRFAIDVLTKARESVQDAHRKQREEMLRSIGRLEGQVNQAVGAIRQIEQYITQFNEFAATPKDEMDSILEQKYAATPDKKNGVQKKKVKAPAKKKTAAKKPSAKTKKTTKTKRS